MDVGQYMEDRVGSQAMEQKGIPKPQILRIYNMTTLMYLYEIMYVCAYRNVKIIMFETRHLEVLAPTLATTFYCGQSIIFEDKMYFLIN